MSRGIAIGGGVLLAVSTLLVFREPLIAMVNRWDVSPMYSYGYIVPVVSAYLLWARSAEFERAGMAPARLAGGALLFASLAALAFGRVNAIQVLEQLAFISALAGIILFLFGRRYLLLSAPAVGYLLFMVPMWDIFTEPLHPPFQENSARLGVAMMRAIGVPVFRDATIISLPNLTMEVARECSGVNYLVAVLALALPMAFLRLRGWWRRITLVISSLIVAALANGLRVALIGALAYWDVGSPLHGPFHVLHGLFVAAVGFVVIFVGVRLLEDDVPPQALSHQDVKQEPHGQGAWRPGDAYGLATVFLTLAFVGVAPQAREVALARPLESLPHQLGQWTANPSGLGSAGLEPSPIAAWSGADRRLARVYRSPNGDAVSVEVYYYAAQVQGRELVSDAAADLHRGAVPIVIVTSTDRFSANSSEWREQGETALFWYDTDGHIEAGQIATKISTMWRAIVSGRTNGAAIVLRTATSATASHELQDLAKALQPALVGLWGSDTP